MQINHASSLRASVNDAPHAPSSGGDGSGDPAGFSSLLRQSQAAAAPATTMPKAAAPAAHADAPARAPDREPGRTSDQNDAAPAEPDDAAANEITNRSRALPKPRPRGAETPAHAKPAQDAASADAKPADKPGAAATAATAGTATTAQIDPGIAHWLAALQRPTGAPEARPAGEAADGANAPTIDDASAARATRADDGAVGADPKDKAAHGSARFAAAADAAGLPAPSSETPRGEVAPVATARTLASADGVAAGALSAAPSTPRDVAAAVSVPIPTPVNAPDFAQTLGLQLSVLAKDGVQRAELHLNPAEMGPVSVQIVMDGTQARIDFGADVAATRSAIEAGLPELASALRDAGFTLAGGGVSQHSSPRGDGGGQPDTRTPHRGGRTAPDDTVARVSTAARRIVTAGGVDLYA